MPVQKNVVGDQPLVRVLAGQVVCLHCRVEVYHAVISNDGVGSRTNDMEGMRSEEHTSELQSLMRISYAVFCLKKKKQTQIKNIYIMTSASYIQRDTTL